jgi:hypothetical protein
MPSLRFRSVPSQGNVAEHSNSKRSSLQGSEHGLRATASSHFFQGVTERVALSPVLSAALYCDIRPDAGRLGHLGDCPTAARLQFAEVEGR